MAGILDSLSKKVNWVFTIVSESPITKLRDLREALHNYKYVPSGFAYWGPALSSIWIAIGEKKYHYSNRQTEFDVVDGAKKLTLPKSKNIVFVSLGVGDGKTDENILQKLLLDSQTKCTYLLLDMSKDLLMHTIDLIRKDGRISKNFENIIPIEVDFSMRENLMQIRRIVDTIGKDKTIIFSLIGNTLANFKNDTLFFELISKYLIKENDHLLLGVSTIENFEEDAILECENEYNQKAFREFAKGSLSVLTTIETELDNIIAKAQVEIKESVIKITTNFIPVENCSYKVIGTELENPEPIKLSKGESIEIYTSRKYSQKYVRKILEDEDFTILEEFRAKKKIVTRNFDIASSLFFCKRHAVTQKRKVVLATSNPDGTQQINTGEELRSITEILDASRNFTKPETLHAVRWTDLNKYVTDVRPAIVHFLGHGNDSGLLFSNNSGSSDQVYSDDLVKIFQDKGVEIVVLNACWSNDLAKSLQSNVKYVVGTNSKIHVDASIAFAKEFYLALSVGRSVEKSFELASRGANKINEEKTGEKEIYTFNIF